MTNMKILEKKKHEIPEELVLNNPTLITYKSNVHLFSSNVAIAGAITAKSRIKLYKDFISTIKNERRILYCDTDSIFAAFKKNIAGTVQDEITWDKEIINESVFATSKEYVIRQKENDNVKFKKFKSKMTFEEFEKHFKEENKYIIKNKEIFKKKP